MFKTRAARIDQNDAAITSADGVFDKSAQRIQDRCTRVATRHHFEQALKLSPDYALAKDGLAKVRHKLQ